MIDKCKDYHHTLKILKEFFKKMTETSESPGMLECMNFITASIFENEDREIIKNLDEYLTSKAFIFKINDI